MEEDQSYMNSYPSVQPAPDEGVISVDVSRELLVDSMTDMSETPIPPDIIASVETTTENVEENERLTLAYERLYDIPKTIVERFSDHIKYLDISHNKITNLDALVYFKSLTSLIADDNPITENCCLPPLPKLELLWLNRCKIESLYPWVGKLKESCPNLQYLSLMGNPAAPSYFNGGTFYEYLQYRLFVISQFPSLNHLDDRRVTDDQRLEAQRLYKRPFFERIAKPAGLSHIVNSSATWNTFQNKINTFLSKDKQGVDSLGHHGLSCSKSAGRIARHASINDIIRRALVTAGVPAVLEPNGLARDDGKRPDGMTIMPWKVGRPLVWDATCVDTLAPSHLPSTASCAGAAAAGAENLKRRKYSNLIGTYMFEPFGVETLGPWGPSAHLVFQDIAKRLVDSSRDQRAGLFFGQRISIAIQRGNAASLLGTFPIDSDMDEFFDAL